MISSYLVLVIGLVLPHFIFKTYGLKSAADLDIFMLPHTKFAVKYSWGFAMATFVICLGAGIFFRRYTLRTLELFILALCAQAFVVWVAMFCYFYDGVTGGMSMHHGPEFNIHQFFNCAFGFFPVTLCLIIALVGAVIFHMRRSQSGHEGN
jgi:hypothetical protein